MDQKIKSLQAQGLTALEITEQLKRDGTPVPFIYVKTIFLQGV